MSVTQLEEVEAALDSNVGGWVIRMTFRDEDAQRFAELSGRAAERSAPQNQLAVVLGDRLVSAPSIAQRIDGGAVEISGNFTSEEAKSLARELGARD
ncbi:hypothetical protein [Streptomyces sp. XM4193]|uniref:SecDF P1 head subdomain-containing protein n=1 Tax=Streptomyces sp. XM4193 TaxID=2929782 RepID=UPI0035AB6EF4